jgi:prepilin-type N-terminal cleavage/methylation domain-containing protein
VTDTSRTSPRAGFTLLEVLLTLLISGVIIAAIGGAIGTYLRVSEVGRAEVERAQLARALLRRIADDLRAAVPIIIDEAEVAADFAASLDSASNSTSTSNTIGTNSTEVSSTTTSADDSVTAKDAATSTASSAATVATAVFYGTQYELQFDMSRLPKISSSLMSADSTLAVPVSADALSDVKRVSYYLDTLAQGTGATIAAAGATGAASAPGGLTRRETSRAAADFEAAQGATDVGLQDRQLAPEVASLEFRYFDGTEWLFDWDSSLQGSLPLCVEILVTLRAAPPGGGLDPLALQSIPALPDDRTYRLVVHLPAATMNAAGATATSSSATSAEASP